VSVSYYFNDTQERLKEMFAEHPQLSQRVNIGFKSAAKEHSGVREQLFWRACASTG
jgi:hypothetical protein